MHNLHFVGPPLSSTPKCYGVLVLIVFLDRMEIHLFSEEGKNTYTYIKIFPSAMYNCLINFNYRLSLELQGSFDGSFDL